MAVRPIDPDMTRILATISACDDFAEPHQLLETHDLSDILTAFSGGLIRCVTRQKDGRQGFSLTPKGEQAAHRAAPVRLKVENDIETLRRDMQQIVASLQEVARKVARHDQSIGHILSDGVSPAPGYAMEMRDLPDPVTGQIRPVECVVRVDGAVAW